MSEIPTYPNECAPHGWTALPCPLCERDDLRAAVVQLKASLATVLACVSIARHNGWHTADIVGVYEAAEAASRRLALPSSSAKLAAEFEATK